jgi:hypothetical protein
LLATQRPSTRLLRDFNLLEKFKSLRLFSIINLQEKGEHALCGDGIDEDSGFSYKPEDVMAAGSG